MQSVVGGKLLGIHMDCCACCAQVPAHKPGGGKKTGAGGWMAAGEKAQQLPVTKGKREDFDAKAGTVGEGVKGQYACL